MPLTQEGLPFSGSTPRARHASYTGAKAAEPKAGSQAQRILTLLGLEGPKTRHQIAFHLSLPVPTVCARLGQLMKVGKVQEVDLVVGPYGPKNTRYGLTFDSRRNGGS